MAATNAGSAADRGRLVRANGVDIYVETFGDPADPAILLIQGVGASMDWWEDDFSQRLADSSRFVIRYDNRDTGQSVSYEPGAPSYGLHDLAADAAGVLDAVGVSSAHFVGLSMGGMVSQLAALDHSGRVASLTLISTSPASPSAGEADLPGISEALLAYFNEMGEPDLSDADAVVELQVDFARALAGSGHPFDDAGVRHLARRVLDRTANVEASLTNHDTVINGPERWRDRLGDVTVPALVIHGTEDPLFPYGHAEALVKDIPGAQLLPMDGVGHELARPAWDYVISAIVEPRPLVADLVGDARQV